jgi:hypothetical protein
VTFGFVALRSVLWTGSSRDQRSSASGGSPPTGLERAVNNGLRSRFHAKEKRRAASPSLVDDDPAVAYDEDLANRIRELIASGPDVSEQTMFGGLVFLVGGKMSVAASGQGSLVVSVDPEETDVLLAKPHAQPFEMRGREMEGRVRIERRGRANQTPARTLGQARRRQRTHASVETVGQLVVESDAGVSTPWRNERPSVLPVAPRRSGPLSSPPIKLAACRRPNGCCGPPTARSTRAISRPRSS